MIRSNDIPLQLSTISLSSDLKTGTKFAAFHTFWKQPLSSYLLNRVQRGIDKDFEHFFNRRDIIWSTRFGSVQLIQKFPDHRW